MFEDVICTTSDPTFTWASAEICSLEKLTLWIELCFEIELPTWIYEHF